MIRHASTPHVPTSAMTDIVSRRPCVRRGLRAGARKRNVTCSRTLLCSFFTAKLVAAEPAADSVSRARDRGRGDRECRTQRPAACAGMPCGGAGAGATPARGACHDSAKLPLNEASWLRSPTVSPCSDNASDPAAALGGRRAGAESDGLEPETVCASAPASSGTGLRRADALAASPNISVWCTRARQRLRCVFPPVPRARPSRRNGDRAMGLTLGPGSESCLMKSGRHGTAAGHDSVQSHDFCCGKGFFLKTRISC